ncbi:hypothetical protein D3C72_1500260 [compost metagenome]
MQQAGEAFGHAEAAAQSRGTQAAHLAGVERDRHAGLAGIAVQRFAQRPGGNIELADFALGLQRQGGEAEAGGQAELQGQGQRGKVSGRAAHGDVLFNGLMPFRTGRK